VTSFFKQIIMADENRSEKAKRQIPPEDAVRTETNATNTSTDKVDAAQLEAPGVGPGVPAHPEGDDVPDIDHVASLGLDNARELEKKIVRTLDMTMLPQLWVLYMFNYLNRVNIAQARLNSFDEDLGLVDGNYQVCSSKR
jgi:hypothetical protein